MQGREPRFLITTSDHRGWIDDSPLLFLGEWCCRDIDNDALMRLDFKIATPYGWEDTQRVRDYSDVWILVEKILPDLARVLNEHHGVNHSIRYWRILLGTWLYKFTLILFNRWHTLQRALENYNVKGAVALVFPKELLIQEGYIGFSRVSRTVAWNQAIYSRILKDFSDVTCSVKVCNVLYDPLRIVHDEFTKPPVKSIHRRVTHWALSRFRFFDRVLTRPTDGLIISSYLSMWAEIKLNLLLGQFPIPRWKVNIPSSAPMLDIREKISLKCDHFIGFENFLRTMIPEQLPTCYLEGYAVLCKRADSLPWPIRPRFIFTSNSFDGDEVFKAWTGSMVEKGVPYFIGQHGANYGTSLFSPSERHEIAVADRFLTWGWQSDASKHCRVGAFPLLGKPRFTFDHCGGLLLVERGGGHQESVWDEFPAFNRYLADQFTFVGALSEQIAKLVTVRLYSAHNYSNWSEDIKWLRNYPEINLDYGTHSIYEAISTARIIVFSYESTGIYELLNANMPVIVFYNMTDYPIRDEALSFYEKMIDAGIFHLTAESAAIKINEVWADVRSWWHGRAVQDAREQFCNEFIYKSEDYLRNIKRALIEN